MPGDVMCVVVAGGCVATSNDCENRNLSRRGGVVIGAEGVLSPASEATACSREEEGSFRSALDLTWSWCVAPAGSEMADEDEKTDAEADRYADIPIGLEGAREEGEGEGEEEAADRYADLPIGLEETA
jgi:hypothetical protein